RRRRGDCGRRGGDVRRPHRRAGAGPRAVPRAGASLHGRPDACDGAARPEGKGARTDSRRAAESRRPPTGLRVRAPMPPSEASVYRTAAAAARRGIWPRLPLSPGAGTVRVAARRPQQRRIAMTRFIGFLAVAALSLALASGAAAEGTLRIGMTAADIPYT